MGCQMNRREQERRDHLIAAGSASGLCQNELADRFGVSERTVRRALGRVRGAAVRPSLDRLTDHCDQLDEAIEQLGIARSAAENPRTVVAAIGAQAQLLMRRHEIWADLGLAPFPDSDARSRLDLFAERLLEAAEADAELDEGARRWLLATTDRLRVEIGD